MFSGSEAQVSFVGVARAHRSNNCSVQERQKPREEDIVFTAKPPTRRLSQIKSKLSSGKYYKNLDDNISVVSNEIGIRDEENRITEEPRC